MSADAYSVCPRCTFRRKALVKQAQSELTAAYGHVSMEEYQVLQDRLTELERQVEEAENNTSEYGDVCTLRENYEIYGAESGSLTIEYGGHCSVCNLTLTVKQDIPFEGIED